MMKDVDNLPTSDYGDWIIIVSMHLAMSVCHNLLYLFLLTRY